MRPNLIKSSKHHANLINSMKKKKLKKVHFSLDGYSLSFRMSASEGTFTMKAKDIIEKLNGGKIRTVVMKRMLPIKTKVLKAGNNPGIIEKESIMQVRGGVEYEKMAKIRAKRDSGIERTDKPSPYKLANGFERTILEHKNNGTLHAALAPLNNGYGSTKYLLNGQPVELEAIKPFIYAQSKSKGSDWMTPNVDTIKEIT